MACAAEKISAHLLHGSPGACSVSGLKKCRPSLADLLHLLDIFGVDFNIAIFY